MSIYSKPLTVHIKSLRTRKLGNDLNDQSDKLKVFFIFIVLHGRIQNSGNKLSIAHT